jgi:hypothetical protein
MPSAAWRVGVVKSSPAGETDACAPNVEKAATNAESKIILQYIPVSPSEPAAVQRRCFMKRRTAYDIKQRQSLSNGCNMNGA